MNAFKLWLDYFDKIILCVHSMSLFTWTKFCNIFAPPSNQPESIAAATNDVAPKWGLGKFRFVAKRIQIVDCASTATTQQSPSIELPSYMADVQGMGIVMDSLQFWQQKKMIYPLLAPLAEDLVSAPASEAFVERIFSVAGMLSTGRRNRITKSLEMRVFLKLNSKIVDWWNREGWIAYSILSIIFRSY